MIPDSIWAVLTDAGVVSPRGVRVLKIDGAVAPGAKLKLVEEYAVPLLPVTRKSMPDVQPSFDEFAQGLKARVERGR